jgi:hypothetical protein
MTEHFHRDDHGVLVRCFHSCRTAVLSGGFWLGVTVSFPFEHLIWEKLWPLNLLTKALGL